MAIPPGDGGAIVRGRAGRVGIGEGGDDATEGCAFGGRQRLARSAEGRIPYRSATAGQRRGSSGITDLDTERERPFLGIGIGASDHEATTLRAEGASATMAIPPGDGGAIVGGRAGRVGIGEGGDDATEGCAFGGRQRLARSA